MEFLSQYWHTIIFYAPLGVIGVWRWSVWATKKIIGLHYRSIKNNGFDTTLSIVTPVYNENPKVFRAALDSWKENKPDEIIAVIDYTDKICIEEFKKFAATFDKAKLIITEKPGKRPALADGIKTANSEIIALVDSDTIWDPNSRLNMLAPFADSRVGGVGTRQDVLETDTLARRLFNIHLDYRYFDEMPFLARAGDAVTCLSGRTALYRREAIMPIVDEMVAETFRGKQCISGEDKCLTRLMQSRGWKARYQKNVRVRTPGVPTLTQFFKQHMRWMRNSWRSDIKSLSSRWIWREKFLALHTMDRFIHPFTLLLGPIYFVFSLVWGYWLVAAVLLIWWHVSRAIKIFPHLKHRPSDIFILPAYVFTVYIMGIIKIYALFTMNRQGWITRWDKSRLEQLHFLKLIPSYVSTAMVVFLLGTGVFNLNGFAIDNIVKRDSAIVSEDKAAAKSDGVDQQKDRVALAAEEKQKKDTLVFSDVDKIDSESEKRKVLGELNSPQFGYYLLQSQDSAALISRRFNTDQSTIYAALYAANDKIDDRLRPGKTIAIPLEDLRNTFKKEELKYFKRPKIAFYEKENIVFVSGRGGSVITLSDLRRELSWAGNDKLLEDLGNGEWILRTNIAIQRDVILVIDGSEVSWLKLKSEDSGFVWLRSDSGGILISNTKITSWDETTQSPDKNYNNERSFVLARVSGRMDIINSELAYLGSAGGPSRGGPFGGSYGVSWKIDNGTINNQLLAGNVLNSRFHDNYFGLYTFGATGMIIKGNRFYNNVQYGLDPHDDSNNLMIENNVANNNGNHGIIVSRNVVKSIIRSNVSYNNALHGIMIDRNSRYNLVENNTSYNNVDGVVVYDSNNNLIRNNSISGNSRSGVRMNVSSSNNFIEKNNIARNTRGVYLYEKSDNNFIIDNFIRDNEIGIYLSDSSQNIVKNSLRQGYNKTEIKLNDSAKTANFIQRIR